MKTPQILLLLVTLLMFGFGAQQLSAQSVPDAVKTKFATDYPDIKKVEWEIEENGFEAEWMEDGYEMAILYDAKGNFLMAETGIDPRDLPEDALEYLAETYPDQEITEACRIDVNHETYYEAEFMLNGEEKEILFDLRGGYLSDTELVPEPAEHKE